MIDDYRRRKSSVNDPQILIANALVNLDPSSIVTSGSNVTAWNNIGTGGSDYDLDVIVGTAANLRSHASGAALLYGASGAFLSTPDSSAASITGSIDIRAHLSLADWTPSATSAIVDKASYGSNNGSYSFYVSTAGNLVLELSPDGTGASTATSTSSVATGIGDNSVKHVRVTWDQSTKDVIFYTSDDGASWTQLGTTQTANIASIFDGSRALRIGTREGTDLLLSGSVYRVQIYNGINGTLAVDMNPADWSTGTTFVSSGTGETWTLNGNTFIQNTGYPSVATSGSVGLEPTAGQVIANPFTLYIVAACTGDNSANRTLADARSDVSKRFIVYISQTTRYPVLTNGVPALEIAADPGTGTRVYTAVSNVSNSLLDVSDVGSASGSLESISFDYCTLFAQFDGSASWIGSASQFLLFDHVHTTTQRAAMKKYLEAKYGA